MKKKTMIFIKSCGEFNMKKNEVLKLKSFAEEEAEKLVIMFMEQEDTAMHGHDYFELTYVTGGTAKHTLNGRQGRLVKGDYFIVDYGSRHNYEECEDFSLINCLFLPEIIDSSLADCRSLEELLRVCLIRYYKQYYGQSLGNHILHDEDGRIFRILMEISKEYEEKKMGYTQIFRGHLMEIMILTLRKIIKDGSGTREKGIQSTTILALIQYLEANYRDRAVLAHFCQEYHFSLPYISSRFKRETGITALEYLQKIRMEKSCELLAGSDLTIQEIAQAVGYEDVRFFGQVFYKFLSMTPSAYRKMAQPGRM